MAHTHTQVLIHLVFATRERRPLIVPEIKTDLHAYMAGIVRNLACHVHALNGVADHCHLIVDLSPKLALADLVNRLKASSTKWVRREGGVPEFGWQRGYGAFAVSQPGLVRAVRYVETQEAHHQKRSLREELADFMELHGMKRDLEFLDGAYRTPDAGG